ncbi:MAG: ABC transporter ATP-binding protein [Arcobacteraceae bacterium]|jgi:zinc transport system ATP-binding protein|nr:ABC transporter ATP-binding protein [Arcobacteraceae bacterium]
MSIVEIKNVSFSYDKQKVLENINLTVYEKDFLAIIGPNGGGKSTLLKLILGINNLQNGEIKIYNNIPSKNLSHIGYVPQNTNINTNFPIRVIDVVMMGHISNEKKQWWEKLFKIGYSIHDINCAMSSLAKVGMEKFAQMKIGSLSGGQRQRVMIARALCANPKILLLDEPTSSIDVDGQKQIYDLLKILNNSITIIVVSHDISVILKYASKVAHINKVLTFHNVDFNTTIKADGGHFCEVEMLQMLGNKVEHKKGCGC